MIRLATIALLLGCLGLSGCAAAPVVGGCTAVLGGSLMVASGVLKLDDDIFNYWAAHRGQQCTAAPVK